MTREAAVAGARAVFVWAGIGLFGAIALVTVLRLAERGLRVAARLDDPRVALGLTALLPAGLAAGLLLLAAWWLAGRSRMGLRLAFAGGLVLLVVGRLAVGLLADAPVDGEMLAFDGLARGMLAGECCFSDRPMGYPLLLAGAYAVLGPGEAAGEALNLGLGLLSGVVLFALVRAHAGARPAVLALYLFALWPAGAMLSNARLSETLYVLLLLLAALASLSGRGWRSAGLGGLLLGAAQYARPTTLALLPAFMLARLWPSAPLRQAVLGTVLPLAAGSLLLLTPVVAYNLEAHDELSLSTSAYGGWSLYIGTDVRSDGRWSAQAASEIEGLTPGGIWEDSAAATAIAVQRIQADPAGFALLAARKFAILWGSEDFGVIYGLGRGSIAAPAATFPMLLSYVFYALLAGLAALSMFRRRRDFDRLTVLCVGVTLIVALIHVFVEVRDRYHAYLTPLFIVLVALEAPRWLAARAVGRERFGRPGGVPA